MQKPSAIRVCETCKESFVSDADWDALIEATGRVLCPDCAASEMAGLQRWFQQRVNHVETDDQEIREWSIVMGYRVKPEQIPALKQRLRDLLDREAH